MKYKKKRKINFLLWCTDPKDNAKGTQKYVHSGDIVAVSTFSPCDCSKGQHPLGRTTNVLKCGSVSHGQHQASVYTLTPLLNSKFSI